MPENQLLLAPQVNSFEPVRVILSCTREAPTNLSPYTIVLQRNNEADDRYSVMAYFIDEYNQRKSVALSQDQVFNLERLMINPSALDEEASETHAIMPSAFFTVISDLEGTDEVCVDIPGIPTSFYYAVILSLLVPTLNEEGCVLHLLPSLPGCDLHMMLDLPEDLTPYQDSYILGAKNELYYVKLNGLIETVELLDFALFHQKVMGIFCQEATDKLRLSQQQVKELIAANGGHTSLPEGQCHQKYKGSYIYVEGTLYYIDKSSQINVVKLDNTDLFIREVENIRAVRGSTILLSPEEIKNLIALNGGHAYESHFQTLATQLFGPLSTDKLYVLKAIFVGFNGTWDSLRVEQLENYMKLFRTRVYQLIANDPPRYVKFYRSAEETITPTEERFIAYVQERANNTQTWPGLLEVKAVENVVEAMFAFEIHYFTSLPMPLTEESEGSEDSKNIRLNCTIIHYPTH